MKKKHIVSIGYWHFALDSVTAATNLVAALSKAEQVDYEYESPHKVFRPMDDEARRAELELTLNQRYRPPAPPKPAPKALALPAPKRGSILCICEKSYVAPRQSCPHCGRGFAESHNRTHGSASAPAGNIELFPREP
jgi:hypothetical protein